VNVRFVDPTSFVNEVKSLFGKLEFLEAVLISSTGQPNDKLLGMATRWDIVQLH